jgi:release factor glutamine methyltransferase
MNVPKPPEMTATYGDVIRDAATRLASLSESPRLDAELLLAHALGLSRAGLLARFRDTGPMGEFKHFLDRRIAHEPVAYILGHREFYSLDFLVRPPVLIPRPETEHLVEAALAFAKETGRPLRMLDLCTGSGCVAVTLAHELPGSDITAVDIAPEAVALAQENAARASVQVRALQGDLFDALPPDEPPFDLITANPPYVETGEWDTLAPDITRYEDKRALLAGEDGLDCVRRIVAAAPAYLRPGGGIALELGEKQYDSVAELLAGTGFTALGCVHDLAEIRRIATAQWPQ